MSDERIQQIEQKWLKLCGQCDAGMGACICPSGDPRSEIDWLVGELRDARAENKRDRARLHEWYQVAGMQDREAIIAERDELRAEVGLLTGVIAAMDKAEAVEAESQASDLTVADLRAKLAAVDDRRYEWARRALAQKSARFRAERQLAAAREALLMGGQSAAIRCAMALGILVSSGGTDNG